MFYHVCFHSLTSFFLFHLRILVHRGSIRGFKFKLEFFLKHFCVWDFINVYRIIDRIVQICVFCRVAIVFYKIKKKSQDCMLGILLSPKKMSNYINWVVFFDI